MHAFCRFSKKLSMSGQTVYTNVEPFMIGVHFNGDETNPTTSTTEASLGFNIYYEQVACSWKPFSYEYFVDEL